MVISKLKNIDFSAIKIQFFLNDVNIDNTFIFKKISPDKKVQKFYRLRIKIKIKPFSIVLSKASAYVKCYDGGATEWMYFWLKMKNYWEKYDDIWNKVSNSIKKEFDSEPMCNKKLLKTKIKSCGVEATDFL